MTPTGTTAGAAAQRLFRLKWRSCRPWPWSGQTTASAAAATSVGKEAEPAIAAAPSTIVATAPKKESGNPARAERKYHDMGAVSDSTASASSGA